MNRRMPVYTVMHFLVDFACIFRLFASLRPLSSGRTHWLFLIVLYNFLAFALPALIGLIADIVDRNYYVAAAGCALVAAGGILLLPIEVPVVLLGVGNGLFHVGIGRQVLADAEGRAAPPGIFICSGALGVFLGTALGPRMLHPLDHILTASLAVSAVLLLAGGIRDRKAAALTETEAEAEAAPEERGQSLTFRTFLTVPALLVFVVVFLRSFYGYAVHYEWKSGFGIGLVFTLCIVAGKCLGGIAADRIGIRLTTVLSLAGSAAAVLFSSDHMFWGCVSILLFNMTMPLTLTLLASFWKDWPGFAFGTLMLALFLGGVPDYLAGTVTLPMPWLCAVSLISMALLLAALEPGERKRKDRDAA